MRLHIEKENKKLKFDFDGPVSLLLSKMNINKEEVVVIRNDEILAEDDSIRNKDMIKISHIIQGRV